MYQVRNLWFRYALSHEESLKNISFDIQEGDFILIAGASGSGKTTLLRHLKKELMPKGERKGSVVYQKQPLEKLDFERSVGEIAYLFQDPSHQMVMDTVWHEIAFGLENMGMPYEQMKRTVAEIVNYFDLQDIYDRGTHELSGGQKQMVNLAALTAMHPKVLVLDEPTAQLDPVGRRDFLSMIVQLQREFQITVIMATHYLEDVMEMADQCIFMENGNIIIQEKPKDAIEILWKKGHGMKKSLPQVIRLAERLGIPPTFSMGKIRNALENCKYQVEKREDKNSPTILNIEHLYAGYPQKEVLKNLSIEIKKQEMFAVVGANGSGKSTLLKCIVGQMEYDGKMKSDKRIVYLPQNPEVVFVHDCLEDDLKDVSSNQEELLDGLLEISGLRGKLKCHPYDLSGGQRQMAALIKVLMAHPGLLLLDEPTKGMDREHIQIFGQFLQTLKEKGLTILCVSHDLEFCAEFADRTGMMFDGRIEGIDIPDRFFANNYFYTTTTAKLSRNTSHPVILPENVRPL